MPKGTSEMNPNRMSCGEARDKLPLYVGGDLDPDVLDAVRGHLDLCGECARRAARAASARRVLLASFQGIEGAANPGLWSDRARLPPRDWCVGERPPLSQAPRAPRALDGRSHRPRRRPVVMLILQVSGGLEPRADRGAAEADPGGRGCGPAQRPAGLVRRPAAADLAARREARGPLSRARAPRRGTRSHRHRIAGRIRPGPIVRMARRGRRVRNPVEGVR